MSLTKDEIIERIASLPDSLLNKFSADCQSWGDQCCGGAGQEVAKSGPLVGHRYGELYYQASEAFSEIIRPRSML